LLVDEVDDAELSDPLLFVSALRERGFWMRAFVKMGVMPVAEGVAGLLRSDVEDTVAKAPPICSGAEEAMLAEVVMADVEATCAKVASTLTAEAGLFV